jgi:membrane protease YdiL (CAAX protease family)
VAAGPTREQMNPGRTKKADLLPRFIAWSAVLASAVPEIIWQESGHRISFWFTTIQSLVLVLAALAVLPFSRLRGLARFLVAVAALNFVWDFLAPALGRTDFVHSLSQNVNWGGRLFLCRGNLAAPAQPIPFLGLRKPIPWTWFGPGLLVIFGVALPFFLYFTVHPDFAASGRIVRFLPWILVTAALNAANEEFQYRNILLAHLRNVVSPAEAALLTAVLFGLGHCYGQPSGPIGVVMAGFAGWIWARSMIETRGFAWAFFIHMVQDVVILSFLAVGAGG